MPHKERAIVDRREQMALRALDDRLTTSELAEMFGVSRPTVRLWRERYRENGRAGLEDRSHATRSCPHRTSQEIERLIIAEREEFGWGSKKILKRLEEAYPSLVMPKRSTVDAILSRHGWVKIRRARRERMASPFMRRYTASVAGELTTIDHKGEFRLLTGRYCYPLTMVDSVSRYLLACDALESTSLAEAWPVIERVFRKHGLPLAIQSDNGPPFGSPGKFSTLSVRLMELDVLPVFGRPGRPQDNGRHERMHRDLKAEATIPPSASAQQQQKRFDEFVRRYNFERPHEGIQMNRPARLYDGSSRPYPKRRSKPEYEAYFETRKVTTQGYIKWHDHRIFMSEALAGHTIGLEPFDEALWTVHFHRFVIGKLDEVKTEFV